MKIDNFEIAGHIVDIHRREIYDGVVRVVGGMISDIRRQPITHCEGYIMPGFVDSHIHIESSMLTPREFGREAVQHGTVAVVTDPHEIANVLGVKGIEFMRESAQQSPIKTFFTIPSCVPATPYDCAGGEISTADIERMAASGEFVALSEMMNIGGVLGDDHNVMAKMEAARRYGLPLDGHAPMLSGDALRHYASHNISTDHETTTLAEAHEKLALGMKIQIREGSACENYAALKSLIASHPSQVMFCCDDLHADDLMERGEIDHIVRCALRDGFDLFDLLNIASANVIKHYNLSVGMLRVGDAADFVVVEDLVRFKVLKTFIDGALIDNTSSVPTPSALNNFCHDRVAAEHLRKGVSGSQIVIELIPGEIITNKYIYTPATSHDNLESDIEQDILKIIYINRYSNGAPQIAYCRGFGLKRGAIASSISHDSHNIIAVGCSDVELARAINSLVESRGGIAVCDGEALSLLPLPIGGIMSDGSCAEVADEYKEICAAAKLLGSPLHAPFMTLSFMSLCVIPTLKIGERGLFDTEVRSWL